MSKRALLLTISSILFFLTAVSGFLFFLRRHTGNTNAIKQQNAIVTSPASTSLGVISANQQTVKVVTDSSSQIDNQQSASATQQNPIDPTTFSQYEKYSGSSSAMFGDIIIGTGASVAAGSKVAIYYSGWLTNGTLFDQNKKDTNGDQQPFLFTEGAHEVILGMEEGVAGMKVGGKRLIIAPPAVGYGSKGQGLIPANATLVFEVTLVASQ